MTGAAGVVAVIETSEGTGTIETRVGEGDIDSVLWRHWRQDRDGRVMR